MEEPGGHGLPLGLWDRFPNPGDIPADRRPTERSYATVACACRKPTQGLVERWSPGRQSNPTRSLENPMLYYAAVFFVLAIVAALFGFGGVAGTLSWAAQILFVAFLALTIVSAAVHALRGRATV